VPTTVQRFFIRAPDHLGDGVLAIPAIQSIAALGPAVVQGPRWAADLFSLPTIPIGHRADADVAVLFKPSLGAAWRVRHIPKRVGLSWDGRWPLLTHAIQGTHRHRVDDNAAIAAAVGACAPTLPSYNPRDVENIPEIPDNSVLLLPGTASPKTVRWQGFAALANNLPAPLFAGGPGDEEILAKVAGPHRILPTLTIPAFAAVAARVSAVIGNDSGLTHLATAARRGAGTDPSKVYIVYGSTSAARTGAPGATHLTGDKPDCWPCYQKQCPIHAPCRNAPVQLVGDALGLGG